MYNGMHNSHFEAEEWGHEASQKLKPKTRYIDKRRGITVNYNLRGPRIVLSP